MPFSALCRITTCDFAIKEKDINRNSFFVEENDMFAVGHLSLGYLTAKGSGRLLKQEINLPLAFALSLLPDIDIIIPGLEHRTITHSVIISILAFIPIFTFFKTRAIPYFIALAQHSLIGDFITGGTNLQGTQLLWPITSIGYGLPINILSATNITIEWTSFLVAIAIMLKTKDVHKLFNSHFSTLSLSVPTLTVLLPSFFHFPLPVPVELIIPHLVYLFLFTLAILKVFKYTVSNSVRP